MNKKDIKSMDYREIVDDFNKFSLEKYRARQVYQWLVKGVGAFEDMTNVSAKVRKILSENYFIPKMEIKNRQISSDGTVKCLFAFHDGELVESVLMKYKHGYSVCLSTQAGCKMGCLFCATGRNGFKRNLYPSEIISQIQKIQEDMNLKVSNIVLMGMGEPLDNYENVIKFLNLVSSPDNLNIGMRHISLSTCGLVDKIYDLAQKRLQLTLSISLHAPNDVLRNRLMKINNKWNVSDLILACKYYIKQTGRRISFEYAMINNLNDTPQCAEELASLLKGMLCHVNLIPLNDSGEQFVKSSSKVNIYRFKNILENKGVNVTVRRTLGKDIEAACGQLKGKYKKERVNA